MQNLVSLNLSAQDLADVDTAIATLRRVFAQMIALQPTQRRALIRPSGTFSPLSRGEGQAKAGTKNYFGHVRCIFPRHA